MSFQFLHTAVSAQFRRRCNPLLVLNDFHIIYHGLRPKSTQTTPTHGPENMPCSSSPRQYQAIENAGTAARNFAGLPAPSRGIRFTLWAPHQGWINNSGFPEERTVITQGPADGRLTGYAGIATFGLVWLERIERSFIPFSQISWKCVDMHSIFQSIKDWLLGSAPALSISLKKHWYTLVIEEFRTRDSLGR